MALQFITGRAGSGKSYRMHQMMIDDSIKHPEKSFVAVVPEQFSMETQKEIIMQHQNHGSFNIEVTSFNRLAYSIFEEQGYVNYKVMDELGKTLVLRKVLEECKEELVIYKKKASTTGFAEKMKSVISELKQYGIGTDEIVKMRESAEDASLIHKLDDIEVIYSAFDTYICDKMITSEDVLSILCRFIEASDFVKNTSFYFDGFTGFTPVQYRVLELLIKHAPDVTIAITLPQDEQNYSVYSKCELFGLSKETLHKLSELAEKNGVLVKSMIYVGENENPYRIKDNQDLCYIEKNIFRTRDVNRIPLKEDALEMHSLQEPFAEVSFVAGTISEMVSKKGYRYNDFAVICGDMGSYYRYLEQEFERYGIPAFIDHKRNISNNPFVDGIKAAIEVVEKDFSYETVFHLLKTGLTESEREDIDLLENYVIQSGKRGYRSYARKWEKIYRGMCEEDLERINKAREELVRVIAPLRSELNKKNTTILDYSKAVYEFIKEMNISVKIRRFADQFHEMGLLSLEKEYEQTYEALIKVINQLTNLMGDDCVTISEYKQILTDGFEAVKVGIIPPGMDTVMVGDIERTRLKDTKKVLFLIGANDGIIPKGAQTGAIITDRERELFGEKDFNLAPTARENVYKERIYLYSLFAKPTEKLYVCFSRSKSDGSVQRESYIINALKRLFDDIHLIADSKKYIRFESITNRDTAFSFISEHMADFKNGTDNIDFLKLSSFLMNSEETKEIYEKMIEGAFYKSKKPYLSKETARRLFENKDQISITKLERYAGCAYQFFLNDGLKLRERGKYELAAFDIGNLYHNALDLFFREVERKDIKWEQLSSKESTELIDRCVEIVVDEYENDVLSSSARNQFIRKKVKETAECSVDALIKHIHAGKFVPKAYELRVIHGRLDRVDTLETEDKIYVKVIDYKSGATEFNIRDTFLGLQLQLMIYLKDAIAYEKKKHPGKDVCPAAGLYFKVGNPFIEKPDFEAEISKYRNGEVYEEFSGESCEKFSDEELRKIIASKLKYQKYRMSGLVNSDINVIRAMDQQALICKKSSDILPIFGSVDKLDSRAKAMDTEQMNQLMDHVAGLAEEMAEKIMEGEIPINPVKDACMYCKFQGICRFDTKLGDRYRELEKYDIKDVKELLKSN